MIRFACPGCSSTFTVADEKAGKTGKCPKCHIQFTIPQRYDAESDQPPPMTTVEAPPPIPTVDAPRAEPVRSVEAPPPMPPPVESDEPVEIAACPKCASRLSVLPGDVGLDVECPNCKTVYRATRTGGVPVLERSKSSSLVVKQKRDDDDEDERPSRRKKSRRDEDDEDEDEDDERPSRRRRRNRRSGRRYEEHRGTLILVFGILGFFVGIFGILAWILGASDLRAMDSGRMDPEGRSNTQTGVLLGKITVILSLVGVIGFCVIYGCFAMAIFGGRPGR